MKDKKLKIIVSATPEVPFKTDLEKYEEAVDTLAQAKSDRIFQNDNVAHAAIVIKKIMEFSKTNIAIFDDDLCGDVSDQSPDFLNVLRASVISEGKTLRIAVKHKPEQLNSNIARTLRELVKLYPDKVQVKLASQEFLDVIKGSVEGIGVKQHINFAVGDNNSFRLEFPAGERKAFCSFQNENFSSVVLGVFEKEFDSCEDYFQESGVAQTAINAVN